MLQINHDENIEYSGFIKDITADHLIQKIGRHEKNSFGSHVMSFLDFEPTSYKPVIGDNINIKYRNGRGKVTIIKGFEPPEHELDLLPTTCRKKKSGPEK